MPSPGLRGMVLGLYAQDPRFDYGGALAEIAAMGGDTVLVLVPIGQRAVDSPRVDPLAPGKRAELVTVLGLARERGLATAVMPIVDLRELAPGKWRGTLAPPDWGTWFESYGSELERIARIAEGGGARLLSIGSELCSSEAELDRWRTLARRIRRVFRGPLTYGANWDHLPPPALVSLVDVAGLNAYYELRCEGQSGGIATYAAAWESLRASVIAPWQRSHGRPLAFLEVGYPSVTGADRFPWDYTLTADVDTALQEQLYAAFLRAWDQDPMVRGVFFYVWWEGTERDPAGYTPRGKPAGELLRAWWRATP